MNDDPPRDPSDTIRLYHFAPKRWAMKVIWERRLKITRYDELNDPFETQPFALDSAVARRFWARRIDEVLAGGHGIVCFSAGWRNPRLWAQYADRHAGICLGFDVARRHAEPVVYLDRPLPDPRALDPVGVRRLPVEVVEAALRHKPACWRDEEEWRVRAPLTNRHDGIAYLPFDAGVELREVILGARCSLLPADVVDAVASPPLDIEIFAARAARSGRGVERHEEIDMHAIAGFRAALARAPDAYWHELPGGDDGG